MTMRDYFAAAALPVTLAANGTKFPVNASMDAYKAADAMLIERSKS